MKHTSAHCFWHTPCKRKFTRWSTHRYKKNH